MEPFLVIAVLLLLVLAVFFGFVNERGQKTKLKKLLAEKSAIIEKTSKLLVEKNLELYDQNIRLQRSLEAKSDFVGVASHQLRTPITEIKWCVENILDGSYGPLLGTQTAQVKNLLESTKKMIRLIDELLHFVDAEAGYKEHTIALVEPEKLIGEIIDEAARHFAEKDIRVERSFAFGNTALSLDVDMIGVAITNIIENAFYYTPSGGTILISTEKKGDTFFLAIKDSGIGIAENKKENVFKKFHRSREALALHAGGVGLGLYITKNIVEQHRGEIGFESESGKGSTFHITLPIHSPPV